jgi:transcriptional regulator with XRE-family HTH domain
LDYILLKKLRILAGFTQKQLGELLGVHHSLVSKIESGVTPIQSKYIQKLKNLYGKEMIREEIVKLESYWIDNDLFS